jgi:hypothetical protein
VFCLVVEIVTWHSFLRNTSSRWSLIIIAWIFQLHLEYFDHIIREHLHLFDLASIYYFIWGGYAGCYWEDVAHA